MQMMRTSYALARSEGFDGAKWAVNHEQETAMFKLRPGSEQWNMWMAYHRYERGRPSHESMARLNGFRDGMGLYWPAPAEFPPANERAA